MLPLFTLTLGRGCQAYDSKASLVSMGEVVDDSVNLKSDVTGPRVKVTAPAGWRCCGCIAYEDNNPSVLSGLGQLCFMLDSLV
jgi:hypothetical protein